MYRKLILVIILIILIVGSASAYYWFVLKAPDETEMSKEEESLETSEYPSSPTEVFLQMKTEAAKAGNVYEVINTMKKYVCAENVKAWEELEKDPVTEEQKDWIYLALMVGPSLDEFTIVKEEISENTAILYIVVTQNPYREVEIKLVLEEGLWKIEEDEEQLGTLSLLLIK